MDVHEHRHGPRSQHHVSSSIILHLIFLKSALQLNPVLTNLARLQIPGISMSPLGLKIQIITVELSHTCTVSSLLKKLSPCNL